MIEVRLKYCSACGEKKPATTEFFHRHTKMKDGLRTRCKACIATPPPSYVVPEEGKRCTQCGEVKPATAEFFQRSRLSTSGLRAGCKECDKKNGRIPATREKDLFHSRKYRKGNPEALTFEAYQLMEFRQCNLCAVCGQPEKVLNPRTKKAIALSIDHNHETGQVRELLCSKCNFVLGYIEKDPKRVKKLTKYLKKWEGRLHDR